MRVREGINQEMPLMTPADETAALLRLAASPARRGFAYAVLAGFGAFLIGLALWQPPAAGWLVVLVGMGAGSIYLAERLRRATELALVLTEAGLADSAGRLIAPLDQIGSVSRGTFAMKPSNGFTLVMKRRVARGWAPGLWWSLGNRIGVGGVTAAAPAKLMAEQIAAMIARREA